MAAGKRRGRFAVEQLGNRIAASRAETLEERLPREEPAPSEDAAH